LIRFRPVCNPLFIGACVAYAINRWWLAPATHHPVLINWFNDLLLIPCALPPLVALYHALGLRGTTAPPRGREILCHLLLWIPLFEWIGPRFVPGTTADPLDAVAYCLGGFLAHAFWRRRQELPA